MWVTDQFVYVHMHKCGGTFINDFLRKFFPESRSLGYHYPATMIPEDAAGLPRLASVRNPWDWYVSYHAFQNKIAEQLRHVHKQLGAAGVENLLASGIDPNNGLDVVYELASQPNTFAQTTQNLLDLGESDLLDDLLARLPTEVNRRSTDGPLMGNMFRGMNLTAGRLAPIRGSGKGFYGFLFDDMHGDADYRWLKMESLREDLPTALEELGVTVSDEMRAHIGKSERMNTSRHRSRADLYTDALAERVATREAGLIARFGYANA